MSFGDEDGEREEEHGFSYDCDCESCREYFIDLEADRSHDDMSDRQMERG